MNYLDIALVIPMMYGVVRGFSKGIINEITALLSIINLFNKVMRFMTEGGTMFYLLSLSTKKI